MEKAELRKEIKRRFAESSAENRARWSEEICQHLHNMDALKGANVVMAFYPLPDEPDIRPLLKQLADDGKTVLLPEVTSDTEMVLRRYMPEAKMTKGLLGTQAPATEVFEDYQHIDAVLVPGVAFDKKGHRMGRGKGYYDRFLMNVPSTGIKIGVCLPYQIVESVPTEEHDFIMDYV